ncbi:MAG: glycosyltransferase family 4 protein [bacterium]
MYGGAERLVVRLCNFLTRKGIQNAILTVALLSEIEKDLDSTEIIVKRVRKQRPRHITRALIKGILEYQKRFDVLNAHNFPANIACLFSSKPVVWMCNEPEAYILLSDPGVKLSSKNWVFYRGSFFLEKHLSKFSIKNAVVADNFNAERFTKLFGFSPKIINYGVDFTFFSQYANNQNLKEEFSGKFVVLHSGTITKLKNQLESIITINKIKDKIPNIRLILIGSVLDPEYEHKIKNYIQEHNLDDYVYFRGHVNRKELREFYYIADVLLHPIKPQGGWLTPFEILSAEKPIIVSEETPPADIIIKEGIGTVTNNYADALLNCYNNYKMYKNMAQKGKKFVSENLRWDHYCEKMLEEFIRVAR